MGQIVGPNGRHQGAIIVLGVLLLLVIGAMAALLRSIHDRLTYGLKPALPPAPASVSVPAPSFAPPRSNRLVAVFPPADLDYNREKRVLREAGGPWDLVILEWGQATREGIARELMEGGARLLYFGGHGVEDRVLLGSGEDANRQWLARIIRQHAIEVIVLNACLSDGLASACRNAGARVVICTAGSIADSEAGNLATAFIEALARPGTTAAQARDHALSSVDDATADMVRLRGDGNWLWERRAA